MAVDFQTLQEQLRALPPQEQLRVARWLIDQAVETLSKPGQPPEPAAYGLLAFAGRFAGGPGDSAERVEAILEAEVDRHRGLSSS